SDLRTAGPRSSRPAAPCPPPRPSRCSPTASSCRPTSATRSCARPMWRRASSGPSCKTRSPTAWCGGSTWRPWSASARAGRTSTGRAVMPAERTAVRTSVLGVRHHGPGSARAVRAELERLAPDGVLIEGPPEADELVPLAGSPELEPPVALLAHVPGEPSRAVFWPFAAFSPEWQAIRYALDAGVPVRFCDLPAAVALAYRRDEGEEAPADPI